jgi:hypothetical protein
MYTFHIDANVNHLHSTLIQMAEESRNILNAGAQGNEEMVRVGVDRIRQLLSDIQAIEQKHREQFDTRSNNEKAKIAQILAEYEKCTEFVNAWRLRYKTIGPIPLLLQLPDGPGAILDMTLPQAWDWNLDVIAFHHKTDNRLIQSMANRGQKRICVYGINKSIDPDGQNSIKYVKNAEEINRYFSEIKDPSRLLIYEKMIENETSSDEKEAMEDDDLIEQINKAFQRTMLNRNTVKLFGLRWVTQAIENLPIIASQPSFKHMVDHLNGLPLVIVSPGPSLDKNIHQLNELQEYAIIVAPSQTALAMQRENIYPDIVMIADPADLRYLMEGFDMTKVQALLIGVSCHPSLYHANKEKVITFNVNGQMDAWISNLFKDTIPKQGCGSVSTNAFMLGGMMKSNPMILMGQDLAFAGSKQYASKAADGSIDINFDEEKNVFKYSNMPKAALDSWKELGISHNAGITTTLPGYFGGEVKTKADYAIFHGEFERLAASIKETSPKIELLNCTEGGAFIKGFEHIPLRKAIDVISNDREKINKNQIFKNIFTLVEKEERCRILTVALDEIEKKLTKSISIAKKCHALAMRVEKGDKVLEELSKEEKELMRKIRSSNFLSITMQEEIRNSMKLSAIATNLKENLGASRILYNIIIEQGTKILPFIKESSKRAIKLVKV